MSEIAHLGIGWQNWRIGICDRRNRSTTMPIQTTSKYSYDSIRETDDVTPARTLRTNTSYFSLKNVCITVGGLAILGSLIYVGIRHEASSNIVIYKTSKNVDGGLLENTYLRTKQFDDSVAVASLTVNSNIKYQKIIGFGGAFTDASAINLNKLPPAVQSKVIDLYFGVDGIGYSLGRIHINSCDFSLHSYSYDDIPGDYELKHFDDQITHDKELIIPFIQRALKASKLATQSSTATASTDKSDKSSEKSFKILASPWSPPAWMKVPSQVPTNRSEPLQQSMLSSASPNGLKADEKTMKSWATYITKFVTAYQQQGINIWAVTPQNEPEFAAPWEACLYNATFERSFFLNYLGPILKASFPLIKILGFDHNKDHLFAWAKTLMVNNPFIDGMAFHWYGGMDRATDGTYGYDNVNATHHFLADINSAGTTNTAIDVTTTTITTTTTATAINAVSASTTIADSVFITSTATTINDKTTDNKKSQHANRNEKILLATEGCSCPSVRINDWLRAERLGHDVMYDLMNYAQGWIDWNLLLDSTGGPNHLGNTCDAPLITTPDFSDIIIQPKYYYFGHFTKFITPGSVRIHSSLVADYRYQTMDPNIQPNVELGVFSCEHSVRQMWRLVPAKIGVSAEHTTADQTAVGSTIRQESYFIELSIPALRSTSFGEYQAPTTAGNNSSSNTNSGNSSDYVRLCVGEGDENRPYLRLIDCEYSAKHNNTGLLVVKLLPTGQLEVVSSSAGSADGAPKSPNIGLCVSLAGDSAEPGALLTLVPCVETTTDKKPIIASDSISHSINSGGKGDSSGINKSNKQANTQKLNQQTFSFNDVSGELSVPSVVDDHLQPLCWTAGWPLLSSVSFLTSEDKTVVVVMNEGTASVTVDLRNVDSTGKVDQKYRLSLSGRSIQTAVF